MAKQNKLQQRIDELEAAIRKHRDTRGHDRCWENDLELYQLLPDSQNLDPKLPSKEEFLGRCQQYYQSQLKKDPNGQKG